MLNPLPIMRGAWHGRYKQLVKDHIMFKDMSADSYLVQAGIASDWPHGRGCYVSEDKQFIIWVCSFRSELRRAETNRLLLIKAGTC